MLIALAIVCFAAVIITLIVAVYKSDKADEKRMQEIWKKQDEYLDEMIYGRKRNR